MSIPSNEQDLSLQKKVKQLSLRYYNQGLDRAQIRDLSGAIDMLKRSLNMDKLNVQARNLLGLVYFETGEAVAALSEWIISKNIQPENNIAVSYIAKLQAEQTKLDVINQTIKKYNIALRNCRDGNEDVAKIQLKRILTQNPRLIKAYHLLSLIYIQDEEWEKARRTLKKAAKIDKINPTTLRFLREVDMQTGTVTSLDNRGALFGRGSKEDKDKVKEMNLADGNAVIQPTSFRETTVFATMLNLVIGVAIGALAVWFLIVPSVRQNVIRESNEKIVEYSNTMANQRATIQALQADISNSNETVVSAQGQIDAAALKGNAYELLIQALTEYQAQKYEESLKFIDQIDVEQLSGDARTLYDSLKTSEEEYLYNLYCTDGLQAFTGALYDAAIENYSKAVTLRPTDYTALDYLAHAYCQKGDAANAIKVFESIIEAYPNSRRATSAQQYIDQIKKGEMGSNGENIINVLAGETGSSESGQPQTNTQQPPTGTEQSTNQTPSVGTAVEGSQGNATTNLNASGT